MDRSSRQKISKEIVKFNNTVSQLDIMDICRLLQPPPTEYTFPSSSWNIHQDHILGHKTHLNKLKRLEIIQCLFSDYSGVKLEISERKITGKYPNMWGLNNILLKYCMVKEEITREIKKIFSTK